MSKMFRSQMNAQKLHFLIIWDILNIKNLNLNYISFKNFPLENMQFFISQKTRSKIVTVIYTIEIHFYTILTFYTLSQYMKSIRKIIYRFDRGYKHFYKLKHNCQD